MASIHTEKILKRYKIEDIIYINTLTLKLILHTNNA